jgi:hypothetical protein
MIEGRTGENPSGRIPCLVRIRWTGRAAAGAADANDEKGE